MTFTLYPSSDCTGTSVYSASVSVAGSWPQTVSTANTTATTASGSSSWEVGYSSTNPAQRSIAASCQEVSSLTTANGSPVSSS